MTTACSSDYWACHRNVGVECSHGRSCYEVPGCDACISTHIEGLAVLPEVGILVMSSAGYRMGWSD